MFDLFAMRTSELRAVDLSVLSEDEKVLFYVNLFHLILLHAYILRGPRKQPMWGCAMIPSLLLLLLLVVIIFAVARGVGDSNICV